jgi:hypothetical protein
MTLEFPHPPAALSPNGNRSHWGAVTLARKKCRQAAILATTQHLLHNNIPTDKKWSTYHIVWNHFGTIMPDDDNVVARIKSYKDGICDALGINDRSIHLGSVSFIRVKETKKKLWITLE